ncbi:MAG: hypothetical protein ABH858_05090 [Candidatus Omnitrophota bacterium]
MGKKLCCILAVTVLSFFLSFNLKAQEDKFALSAKAGTLGLGMEGTGRINDNLNYRLGVNAFQYDYDGTESDIKYDFDLELLSFSALVDWFPFNNAFRLTAGALANENQLDLKAETTASYQIGNVTYTAAQVGTLNGSLDFDAICPYAGIGWGNPFGKDGGWSFAIDLGVMYQGSPDITLRTNGTLSANAAFLTELRREENNLESDIEEFEFYPVISLAVTYRF